jgi:hypothetical protein
VSPDGTTTAEVQGPAPPATQFADDSEPQTCLRILIAGCGKVARFETGTDVDVVGPVVTVEC